MIADLQMGKLMCKSSGIIHTSLCHLLCMWDMPQLHTTSIQHRSRPWVCRRSTSAVICLLFQVAYVTTCSILQSIGIHCFIISLLYVMCETALWNGDMLRYLNSHDGTLDVTRACCKWIRSCARVNCGHDERLRQTAMKSHVVLSFQ